MQKSSHNHLTGKHLCWRFFLINFIKKRHQHRCFPVNITKCLSTAFYIDHIPFIYISEILCDDRIRQMSSGTKLIFFIFLVSLLCFPSLLQCLNRKSIFISYISCFYTKMFIKCNFCTDQNHGSFTVLIESLKFRNNSRTLAASTGNLL